MGIHLQASDIVRPSSQATQARIELRSQGRIDDVEGKRLTALQDRADSVSAMFNGETGPAPLRRFAAEHSPFPHFLS
jgi:hypothetical protein